MTTRSDAEWDTGWNWDRVQSVASGRETKGTFFICCHSTQLPFLPFPFPTLSQSTSCHCLPALINHFNKRFYPTCQPIPSSRVRHPVFAHPVCILSTEQQSSPSDMQVRAECVNELNCFTEFRGMALRVQPQVSNTPEERMKMEEGCSL